MNALRPLAPFLDVARDPGYAAVAATPAPRPAPADFAPSPPRGEGRGEGPAPMNALGPLAPFLDVARDAVYAAVAATPAPRPAPPPQISPPLPHGERVGVRGRGR